MGRVPFSHCWFGRGSPYGWCFLFFSEMLRAAFWITALELDRVSGSLGLSAQGFIIALSIRFLG